MIPEQWATVEDAARITRVRPGTIRVWVTRGKVAVLTRGAHRWVSLADVRRAERDWRDRITRV